MVEEYSSQQFFTDINTRIRVLEDKQKLIRERVLLLGDTLIEERDSNFKEIQDTKKTLIKMKDEQQRIKELLQKIIEQLENLARKEEVMILQRQFDMFRKS